MQKSYLDFNNQIQRLNSIESGEPVVPSPGLTWILSPVTAWMKRNFRKMESRGSWMAITVIKANLHNCVHRTAVLDMMDAYSRDPMGDDRPLSEYARKNLLSGLIEHPTTIIFLVFDGENACAIATCFRGFSTFAAKPLINVSDFYVEPRLRGTGIGRKLLDAIEFEAKSTGCCKLTLEVQQNNKTAQSVYRRFGFQQAVYPADAGGGGSLYMIKPLT